MDEKQLNQLLIRAKKLQQENKFEPAKIIYSQILQHYPNHPDVNHLLGILFNQLQQPQQAIVYLQKAISLNPTIPQAYHNLGLVYKDTGEIAEAIKYYEKALAINPRYYQAMHKLANAYHNLGKIDLANTYYEKTLTLNPEYAEGWQDYGIYYLSIKQNNKAKACFEKAIAYNPKLATAYVGLGNIFAESNHFEQAIQAYKTALQIKADLNDAYTRLARVYDEICDWQNLGQRQKRLHEITQQQLANHEKISIDPFSALAYHWPATEFSAIARNYAQEINLEIKPLQEKLNFQFKITTNSRVKIGYISAAFRNHATTHLIYNLFALHNREKFEIFAFSLNPPEQSDYYQHLQETADHFIDLSRHSNMAAAQKIYNAQIDILIDLDGYTRGSRTPIIALRPAPLQIAYLGFPGTTGANFIDYMLVDDTVITENTAATYTEKLIYLPNCYQINNNQQVIAQQSLTRQQYHLPENAFVFCCFNSAYKIEPEIFAVWMAILAKTPEAVLWLFSISPLAEKNLCKAAEKHKIDPQRLLFAHLEEKSLHLARYRLADLFLDTFYVNAHTTASDALWAGLPILTCPGNDFINRVSASLLKAIGLPELIMPSLDAYADAAIYYYQHRAELAKIRTKLLKNRDTTALFDTMRFVKNLEKVYEKIWKNHQAGNLPHSLKVEEYATNE